MLKPEQNQALMEVGPGTLMGDLLRRYWTPFAAAGEMDDTPVKPVRLMGEDLVLYKDGAATTASSIATARTAARTCPTAGSRSAASAATTTAGSSTTTGACIHQPFEEIAHPDARFKDRITIKAYPVEERAGLLWAYMGPLAGAAKCPIWEPFTWGNGFVQIVLTEIPCNWFQCQENSIDPVHFEWLHDNWGRILRGADRRQEAAHPPADRLRRVRARLHVPAHPRGPVGDRTSCGRSAACACGRTGCSPATTSSGACRSTTSNTLSVGWFFDRVPEEMEPFRQQRIPYWYGPIKDETDRPLARLARHEPGLRRPGWARAALPIGRRSTWAKATAASS